MSAVGWEDREQQLALSVRAIAVLARQFDRVCQEAGLSLPQYRLLLYVQLAPQRASVLAERIAVKRPTLTALVDGLVEAGLIRRLAVEGDRRGIRLELTDAGQRKFAAVESELSKRLSEFTAETDEPQVLGALSCLAMALANRAEREFPTH